MPDKIMCGVIAICNHLPFIKYIYTLVKCKVCAYTLFNLEADEKNTNRHPVIDV